MEVIDRDGGVVMVCGKVVGREVVQCVVEVVGDASVALERAKMALKVAERRMTCKICEGWEFWRKSSPVRGWRDLCVDCKAVFLEENELFSRKTECVGVPVKEKQTV